MASKILKLLLAAVTAITFAACQSPIESPENLTDTPKDKFVKVLPSGELNFSAAASECSLRIESSGEWEIFGMSDWCTVSPNIGSDGDKTVVSVTDNFTKEPRVIDLLVICDGVEAVIHVVQERRKESSYVDMEFEKAGTTMQYNLSSGTLTISYPDGKIPDVEVGSTIVLPSDYMFGIRIVDNISNNGNTLTLETSQGNMCNLFKNTSFTLSTNGVTRSAVTDGCPVITPAAIGYIDENGKYVEVYNQTKSTYDIQQNIWTFHKDYDNETIYNGTAGSIWWEKCAFDSSLDAIFEFEFSESAHDDGEFSIGELQKFGYKLHGSYGADLLLRYHFDYKKTWEYNDIVKKNILPKKVFTFIVNGIPVPIIVSTHLGHYASLTSQGRIDVSGGLKADLNIDAGLSWSRNNGVEPIYNATPSLQIYHPTIEAEASATIKMSTYPQVEFGLYDFIGPWVEPRPYVKEIVQAGARASTDGNSYIGWTDEFFWGTDMKFGLSLDFGIWDTNIESKVYNTVKDRLFATSPSRISLLSPQDENICITEGESLDIEFKVESYSPVTDNYWPCAEAAVLFETESGELSDYVELTDKEGIAKVTWKPECTSTDEAQTLRASIVDSKGNVIDEITFDVKVYEPMILNSISYKNDYYYFKYNNDKYISYTLIADISGDTSLIKDFMSCGIYIYDVSDGKYYILEDGLSGYYNNTKINIEIDTNIDIFDNINYSSYYAESNQYYYGIFVQYTDGSYYLSELQSCPLIYDRYPSYSYLSVGPIYGSTIGVKEDYYGDLIYEYEGTYQVTLKIDGALWIDSIQAICYGDNWSISDTGSQYGVPWTPAGDYEYESSGNLHYWSTTEMYHQLYEKIVTVNGDTLYSNSLIFGGSPENPTVRISGTKSAPAANNKSRSTTLSGVKPDGHMNCQLNIMEEKRHSEIKRINQFEQILRN